ncbi:MAG: hypothetical protein K2H16_00600, partial [Prevotella sp.]|nr:hypothetical protein [Prevotella sp.]
TIYGADSLAISPYTAEISETNPPKTKEIGCFILFFILFLLENQGKNCTFAEESFRKKNLLTTRFRSRRLRDCLCVILFHKKPTL